MSHAIDPSALARLLANRHHDPHSVLGAHPVAGDGRRGIRVASYHPDATRAEVVLDDGRRVAAAAEGGLFVAFVPGAEAPLRYQWSLSFADGHVWQTDDPYRFLPSVGELDLHLLSEGTHRRLWEVLGAHVRSLEGVAGVAFAVWAPNAERVSVVGDFCGWDGRRYPMRSLGRSGVFELFIPGLDVGTLYKFEILGADGEVRLKTDPMATAMEIPPDTASRVTASSYAWGDGAWREKVRGRDARREPWAIYEVHLGSWARVVEERHRPLSYREIAPKLVRHVRELGFNAIELLPVTEHPFFGSWGYQVSGYYAPTARYGAPDDLRYLIDHCHQNGVAVLMDWVPAHFPKDTFALARFDGTALYEHADPRRGEHPDWGTLIFNYGRPEVRNFLIANALYWLEEFHVDGLRVDAVASMLYLDYSRRPGAWVPNPDGSRENHDAVAFLRALNDTVHAEHPEAVTVAEESTAWPGVTAPTAEGGLGFTFKWNMGWMHDTLHYFQRDPVHRRYHHDNLTFGLLYAFTENFILPLSHDEVVH
ncbi:MAG TPA: 1,4-alpha-glucan branching enzyme, partial [Myxococcota bacterium]|nr:1,4-alpha-glucan branching enzyme [Myxococcota bacterium]